MKKNYEYLFYDTLSSTNTYCKEQFTNLDDLNNSHPRKPRAKYSGEIVQMDASVYIWFGNIKLYLHIAIDDATGAILGAYFDRQETLNGYYQVFYQNTRNINWR